MEDDRALTVTALSVPASPASPLRLLRGRWAHPGSTADRRRRGRWLLRDAAASLWGDGADPVVSARCPRCGGDHGRPLVTDGASGRRLPGSVTHAGPSTLVALGPPTVGIDAELLDGDRERFAAIREVTGRSTASARDGLDALRLWTTIEAVLKADGRGLEVDPRRVGIDGPAGMTGSTARVDGGPRFALLGIQSEGLVVTVAVPGPGSSL